MVGKLVPAHCTVLPGMKLPPTTISWNAGPPALTLLGFSELIEGGLIGKAVLAESGAPGTWTVMFAVPAVAIRFAGTSAVNRVGVTLVVNPFPFHWITDPLRKPEPDTVSWKAELPATAAVGVTVLIVGAG